MKRNLIILGVVVVAATVFYYSQPERFSDRGFVQAWEAQREMDKKNAPKTDAPPAQPADMKAATPANVVAAAEKSGSDVFKVKFECSNGNFVIEVHRDWAPVGVHRFEELVKEGYYNENRFFRVVPGFVVQFGISGDPAASAKWREKSLVDDPVKESNLKGYVTFATSGKNSRTTQLFISLADNTRLDASGFSPFGKVIEGMDVVEKINAEYGQSPDQYMIQESGNDYLTKMFPRMDYIKSVTIVP